MLKQWIALKARSNWLLKLRISFVIIQHIVTMSKYGHSALNISRAYSTYILRYT